MLFLRQRRQSVTVTALRSLRYEMELSQLQLARALSVPVNSLRMWDSGLRITPESVMKSVFVLVAAHRRQREPLPIPTLAAELGIHKSTPASDLRPPIRRSENLLVAA